MTPSELNKIREAAAARVASLLARESNAELSAEELAEDISSEMIDSMVETYEAIQAKSYNLVVLGHFRLDDDTSYVAAVGPLSTRAVARARDIGERFAWDYKTRRGNGKYVLVPLIRNPGEAWDEARNAGLDEYVHHLNAVTPKTGAPTYEPMRLGLSEAIRSKITADWQMDPEILARKYGPHCLCGRYTFPATTNLGDPVTLGCPAHPEERTDGSDTESPGTGRGDPEGGTPEPGSGDHQVSR